jgi:TrmH family RNA methyltransferase
MKQITSVQNPFIKSLVQLQEKAKVRNQTGTFLIEGKREIELALKGGYEIETILFLPEIQSEREIKNLLKSGEVELIEISKEVYQKLAYRDTTEGILAIAKTKSLALSDLKLSKNPLILVGESLEKPGNVGAILRTADAANIDAVIIANPKSDLYNPNIVRSSVGCLFTRQIAVGTTEEVIAYLKANNIIAFLVKNLPLDINANRRIPAQNWQRNFHFVFIAFAYWTIGAQFACIVFRQREWSRNETENTSAF